MSGNHRTLEFRLIPPLQRIGPGVDGMEQVRPEEMRRIRRLTERHGRADSVRGRPCPVCGRPGTVIHHVFPIRYGGSCGVYNLMATCLGRCHSYLNKASNRYCRRHEEELRRLSALQATRRIRKYIRQLRVKVRRQRDRKRDAGLIDRYRGCLLGLAVGDALGTTLEFRKPGTFEPIDDMIGGGPFHLEPGQWTDDTSMALCLAESLIDCRGLDPVEQLERYCRWWRDGYLSSTGECFNIGSTVRAALATFEKTGEPYPGPTDPSRAGNGCIMRLAPVPMFSASDPGEAVRMSAESSRTTHGTEECVAACRYLGALIVGALTGAPEARLLSDHYEPVPDMWKRQPLSPRIAEAAGGSFKRREPPEIRGTGYVVESLEAALWAFHRSESFKDGALLAVNLGDDADTTGAVYGQLAGAFYGASAIPKRWLGRLSRRLLIETFADQFHDLASTRDRQPGSRRR